MRLFICVLLLLLYFVATVAAQAELQKLVDTEHAFARLAAEKGIRTAFLANMSDEALVFSPEKANGRAFWTARSESNALLSWAPNYADISADGAIGYTTGNWEWRAKGKDDVPAAFGEFITVWRRQSDGSYKFLADIGVSHAKPEKYSTEWSSSKVKTDAGKRIGAASVAMKEFVAYASKHGTAAAFTKFAAKDIRLYRDDNFPFFGKTAALVQAGREKGEFTLETEGVVASNADLAYFVKGYTLKKAGGLVERGNAVQIWKFQAGRWVIVLDILKPVPSK